LAGGLNPYLYANGNPLRYADPYGLFGFSDATDAVFGAVWYATDGWSPSQALVDFSAGWGDEVSFGITRQLRDLGGIGSVDRCSRAYAGGEVFGFANTVALGWAKGTQAAARAASPVRWSNFSHSGFSREWLGRFDNGLAKWLNRTGNRLNGDYIPTTGSRPDLHDLMDATASQIGGSFNTWPAGRRLINRVPMVPGTAAYAGGSALLNECGCN